MKPTTATLEMELLRLVGNAADRSVIIGLLGLEGSDYEAEAETLLIEFEREWNLWIRIEDDQELDDCLDATIAELDSLYDIARENAEEEGYCFDCGASLQNNSYSDSGTGHNHVSDYSCNC